MVTIKQQVTNADFPSLFQAADSASNRSQVLYMRLVKADLAMLFVGALLTSITVNNLEIKVWLNIFGAILLLLAFATSLGLKFTRYEKTWYGARAVAESVKTLSWRYMTCAKPFDSSLAVGQVDHLFVNRLEEILLERKNLAVDFPGNITNQISDRMKEIRQLPWEDKKNIYLNYRVQDQRAWYNKKSEINRNNGNIFFVIAIVLQFIAFAFAMYRIKDPNTINLAAVFATGTAALFSWIQIKKFHELAQVYALTAQELGFVETKAAVTGDMELSSFVADSENAISREHIMWTARRDC